MIAEIFGKYLRKVRDFAKEDSAYEISKNVKIIGTENGLTLYCCDGDTGIRQNVKVHGKPIIGEFCVNVFHLSDIIHKISPQVDVEIKVNLNNYNLNIFGPAFKFQLAGKPPDQIFNMNPHTTWHNVKESFFDKIKSVVPLCLHEEYPISYDGEHISYISPHLIIYIPQKMEDIGSFKTNTKLAAKIFVDLFDKIDVTDKNVFLSNENCEIYIPQIIQNSPKIDPILKAIKEHHTIVTDVNTTELASAYNVIESLAKINEYGLRGVELTFEKNTLVLRYLDSEFLIADVKYQHPTPTVIKVPFDHLKVITAPSFIREAHYVKILLAERNTMFVTQKGPNLTLAGGLSK